MHLFDCHVHSNHSLDARYPMEDMLKAAYEAGLKGVAITDHSDMDFSVQHNVKARMADDVAEMRQRKEEWKDKLELIMGVEIGQALYLPRETQDIIDCGGYDFVIAATHSVRNVGGFYSMSMGGCTPETIDKYLKGYFNDVTETVSTVDFDTLPHLTYPLRYIRQAVDFPVDFQPYEKEIRRIMDILADRGKAYELNMKPYAPGDEAWRAEECWLLEMFRAAGGREITLGTDAHVPEKVGYGIAEGVKMLRDTGFDHYTVYRQRKPCAIMLED